MTALRSSRPAALRAAAAAVAVAAAFGPTAELPGRRVFRVLLVDASQSCRRSAATAEELAAFRAGPARGDTGAVIGFADGA